MPTTLGSAEFPLDAYAQRIGYSGNLAATTNVLDALHSAHAYEIPFENLDVVAGRGVRLDLQSLVDKIIVRRRGGYCYEVNGLFAHALERMGVPVQGLAARNLMRPFEQRQRTHLTLLATIGARQFLCDLGFGIYSPILPIPFEVGIAHEQFGYRYRIDHHEFGHRLAIQLGDEWQDLYSFSLEPCPRVDFEIMNYFNSTHPSSPFVQTTLVARPRGHLRFGLRDRTLTTRFGIDLKSREISDAAETERVLSEVFGLSV
ncbi:MAG: arylamine N-acetyltransferase [Tahibacter sp.]